MVVEINHMIIDRGPQNRGSSRYFVCDIPRGISKKYPTEAGEGSRTWNPKSCELVRSAQKRSIRYPTLKSLD